MKEDILEQLVDEYLMHKGYFTIHNVKFKPRKDHPDFISKADAVTSDIDVLAIHPRLNGHDRVIAVSCKSWQQGFSPGQWLNAIENDKSVGPNRKAWHHFRELCIDKWSDAFIRAIEEKTGTREFTYWIAVARLTKPSSRVAWENSARFRSALQNNPIRLISFDEMLEDVWGELTTTVAATELGRMIQLMKASRWFSR